MLAYRHVLFVSDECDAAGLADAIAIALGASARLTVAIAVYEPSGFAYMAPADLDELREDLLAKAHAWAFEALALAPPELDISVRVVPCERTAALKAEVAEGCYDLCVVRATRLGATFSRTAAAKVVRHARRRRVATLALPAR